MSLDKAMQELKFDSRMVPYNLNNGIIKPEELKKHLESLPDHKDNALPMDLEESSKAQDFDAH